MNLESLSLANFRVFEQRQVECNANTNLVAGMNWNVNSTIREARNEN
jgi:predicted ATP-dependent endonuclease of OLD family